MYKEFDSCSLCPRECKVNRNMGDRGFCGALNTAEINRIGLHFMEEPIISGQNGSGTVFFTHCTLGCIYCQNYEISRSSSKGKELTAPELTKEYLKLEAMGANNINLVSPTQYMPIISKSIDIAREKGIKIPFVYNTGGFEKPSCIKYLNGKIDIYLTDLKYVSPYLSGRYSKTEDYFDYAIEAIREMVNQRPTLKYNSDGLLTSGVIIRHLILPGQISDTKAVLRKIGANFGDNVVVSLMRQYTPISDSLPDKLSTTVTDSEYMEALEEMELLGLNGFGQEKDSVGKDKVPSWDI